MLERYDIEEIILGMAAIVMENRALREELNKSEKKYKDFFDAIMGGAFVYRETE